MGSPITFSGFNSIDFNAVLEAIMTQESQPLTDLQNQQKVLQTTNTNLTTLATKLATLQSAADALATPSSLDTYAASVSDSTRLSASSSTGAVAGDYEVVVSDLARAQVTVSATTSPDADSTIVAAGGTISIGGVTLSLAGPVTLSQLAAAINTDTTSPASASIVQTSPGAYSLVLTGKDTGAANSFTVTNNLTSSTISFKDTDGDGVSGDDAADNVLQATNAALTINGVAISSTSNTLDSGIPGVTLTLRKADPTISTTVSVTRDTGALVDKVQTFANAYNDIVAFANNQSAAAAKGTTGTIDRDPMFRTLQGQLRNALNAAHGSASVTRLAEIGLGFTRTGELTVDSTRLTEAIAASPTDVSTLFSNATTGAFTSISDIINDYTKSGGFVPGAKTRLSDEMARLDHRIDDLQARLALRRSALQKEFIAADQAMSRLNSQQSTISSFSSGMSSAF